jgi:hypothetical protein
MPTGATADRARRRRRVAFLVAPLIVPSAFLFWLLPSRMSAGWLITTSAIAAIFSYLGTLVLGIPIHRLCRVRNLTAPWIGGIVGFVVGDIVWLLFGVLFPLSLGQGLQGVEHGFKSAALWTSLVWPAGTLGAISGAVFWAIAGPSRGADDSVQLH